MGALSIILKHVGLTKKPKEQAHEVVKKTKKGGKNGKR